MENQEKEIVGHFEEQAQQIVADDRQDERDVLSQKIFFVYVAERVSDERKFFYAHYGARTYDKGLGLIIDKVTMTVIDYVSDFVLAEAEKSTETDNLVLPGGKYELWTDVEYSDKLDVLGPVMRNLCETFDEEMFKTSRKIFPIADSNIDDIRPFGNAENMDFYRYENFVTRNIRKKYINKDVVIEKYDTEKRMTVKKLVQAVDIYISYDDSHTPILSVAGNTVQYAFNDTDFTMRYGKYSVRENAGEFVHDVGYLDEIMYLYKQHIHLRSYNSNVCVLLHSSHISLRGYPLSDILNNSYNFS